MFLSAAWISFILHWVSFESWYIVVINYLRNAGVNLKRSVHLGVSTNVYQSILTYLFSMIAQIGEMAV